MNLIESIISDLQAEKRKYEDKISSLKQEIESQEHIIKGYEWAISKLIEAYKDDEAPKENHNGPPPPCGIGEATDYSWQSIETAPKDGRLVLIGFTDDRIIPPKVWYFDVLRDCWADHTGAPIIFTNNMTHWAPLPPNQPRS